MRLQKYMAACGVASRRKSEELIALGKVAVNGQIIDTPGFIINPVKDKVEVYGKEIFAEKKFYFVFNKPSNVLCTAGDPRGRKTIYDYFKSVDARLFTVGRLDYRTSGLIIVTNDGDFANHISHPKHEKEKEYTVRINSYLSDNDIKALTKGVEIDGHMTSEAKVSLIERADKMSAFNIVIHEGRNRQVRNMAKALGHKVIFLRRVRISNIEIGSLKEGSFRNLTRKEIELLKK